jgi:flagellar assembly protein FliH
MPEPEVMSFPYSEVGGTGPPEAWNSQKEQQRREEAAREAGRREGEERLQARFDAQLLEIRKNVAASLDEFARQRREYFRTVESEVVQLALAIARKVLRRETQLDPLLLAGMVRVALEQTAQATHVIVRVAPNHVSDFRVFFARHMQENAPEVVEDASLPPEQCVLHTELGTTTIGPEVQLKEIEQGLADLQAAKPRVL